MSVSASAPTAGAAATTTAADYLPANAKVLLVRLSALGDVIFALETLATLKHQRPDVRVDFLIEDRFASILAGHPSIDHLIEMPRQRPIGIPAHLRRLRTVEYDVVIDLHGILKSSLQVLLARARLKIGYQRPGSREGAAFAYHRRIALPSPMPHRAARGRYLLRELGLEGRSQPALLPHKDGVEEFFPDDARTKVILHPGTSSFATFKRWPIDKFIELATHLQGVGVHVAMSYGPGEADMFETVRARVPGLIEIDGQVLGLLGLGQAMRQADLVVAADTGPLHIAASVGTKVIALFGPKDSDLYGPRGSGHRVLFHDVPCRPCKLRKCASPQCVLGIEVAEVKAAVEELSPR